MLILALDSTALVASVAICEDERLLAEFTVNTGHTHSETLLPMVEAALKVAGKDVRDIDRLHRRAGVVHRRTHWGSDDQGVGIWAGQALHRRIHAGIVGLQRIRLGRPSLPRDERTARAGL